LSKLQKHKPALSITKARELCLSGAALTELLQAVFSKGSLFRFQAKGFSMSPFIKDGDVVTISPLRDAKPRLGDVVALIHSKTRGLLIHRVVGKKGDSYIIRGDSTFEMDDLLPRTDIVGRVIRVERDAKRITLGLGPERVLIAFFSRRKFLFPIILPAWRLFRPFLKRWLFE